MPAEDGQESVRVNVHAGEPIFQGARTASPAVPGPQVASQERAIASRMTVVERKLSGLQGACIGLEEDSSAVAARLESLEVPQPGNKTLAIHSHVTY